MTFHPEDYEYREAERCGCTSYWREHPELNEDGDVTEDCDHFEYCHTHAEAEQGDREHHARKDMER